MNILTLFDEKYCAHLLPVWAASLNVEFPNKQVLPQWPHLQAPAQCWLTPQEFLHAFNWFIDKKLRLMIIETNNINQYGPLSVSMVNPVRSKLSVRFLVSVGRHSENWQKRMKKSASCESRVCCSLNRPLPQSWPASLQILLSMYIGKCILSM